MARSVKKGPFVDGHLAKKGRSGPRKNDKKPINLVAPVYRYA